MVDARLHQRVKKTVVNGLGETATSITIANIITCAWAVSLMKVLRYTKCPLANCPRNVGKNDRSSGTIGQCPNKDTKKAHRR